MPSPDGNRCRLRKFPLYFHSLLTDSDGIFEALIGDCVPGLSPQLVEVEEPFAKWHR